MLVSFSFRLACPSYQNMAGISVFLILFTITFLCYCIIGYTYKSFSTGVSGIDAVPNIDFWRFIGRWVDFLLTKYNCCGKRNKFRMQVDGLHTTFTFPDKDNSQMNTEESVRIITADDL